jgi:hypothetical protein
VLERRGIITNKTSSLPFQSSSMVGIETPFPALADEKRCKCNPTPLLLHLYNIIIIIITNYTSNNHTH